MVRPEGAPRAWGDHAAGFAPKSLSFLLWPQHDRFPSESNPVGMINYMFFLTLGHIEISW